MSRCPSIVRPESLVSRVSSFLSDSLTVKRLLQWTTAYPVVHFLTEKLGSATVLEGLSVRDRHAWTMKNMSTLHSVISIFETRHCELGNTFDDFRGKLKTEVSYYIFNTVWTVWWGLRHNRGSIHTSDLTHHVLFFCLNTIVGSFQLSDRAQRLCLRMASMYYMVITNPFLNIRWQLKRAGKVNSAYYRWNMFGLSVAWLFGRILLLPYLFYKFAQGERISSLKGIVEAVPKKCLIASASIMAMNAYFLTQFGRGVNAE